MNLAKSFFNIIIRLFRHNKTEELGQGIEQEQVTEKEDSASEADKKKSDIQEEIKRIIKRIEYFETQKANARDIMISENKKLPQNRNDNVIESCMEQIEVFDRTIEDLCKEEKELWNQLYETLMNNTESNESGEVVLPSEVHNKYSEYRANVVTSNTIGIDESTNKDKNVKVRSESEITEK